MSGIYIPMEMPKSCFECNLKKIWDDGVQCLVNKGLWMDCDSKHKACPLFPVPNHGDLIDRDKLREKEFINDGDAYAVVMSRDIRTGIGGLKMAEYTEKSTVLAIIGKHWRSKIYADDAIQAALDEIANLPAADVQPVRHGRWIFGTTMHHDWMKCSECLVSQDVNGCFSYCPNCGAKMDKENE